MSSKKIGRIIVPPPDNIDVNEIKEIEPIPVIKPERADKIKKQPEPVTDKFEITNIPVKVGSTMVFVGYRIRALRDIGNDVKKGDLGGAVQRKDNLSQKGDSWIYPGAIAAGHSVVKDNAILSDGAVAYDRAEIYGNAKVVGQGAMIGGTAHIHGNALVSESFVEENADVSGSAIVEANSHVFGKAKIYEDAIIHRACVSDANVHGKCIVDEDIWGGDHIKTQYPEDISW